MALAKHKRWRPLLAALTVLDIVARTLALPASWPYENFTTRAPELPSGVAEARYSLPLRFDPLIWNLPPNTDAETGSKYRVTQLQGDVWYPEDFKRDGSHPLVVMLPGQHADCRTTIDIPDHGVFYYDRGDADNSGKCPEGQTVVRSHDGFRYLGQALAQKGFFVISVDPLMLQAIPGSTADPLAIASRARLMLRTIEAAQLWGSMEAASMQDLGIDITGAIDWQQIGLFGHSRGGQAARYAANLIMTPHRLPNGERRNWASDLDITITGVLEVSPVDADVWDHQITVVGVPWLLVASGCEDDVGTYTFYTLAQRQSKINWAQNYVVTVYGANHGFFNSEWPTVRADACLGDQDSTWDTTITKQTVSLRYPPVYLVVESQKQQDTLTWASNAFFGAHVGQQADPSIAAALRAQSPVEAGSGQATVSGVEIGHWNPNYANSQILRDLPFHDVPWGINVEPAVGEAKNLDEHMKDQWSDFVQVLGANNFPPNIGLEWEYRNYILTDFPTAQPGVAIPLSAKSMKPTTITIELEEETSGQNPSADNRGTCEVQIDVARRNTCYMHSSMFAKDGEREQQHHHCAQPKVIDVVLKVGDAASAPLPLRSRFNMEFGPLDFVNHMSELSLLPVAWETIVAPCDVPVKQISIELTPRPDPDPSDTDSTPGNDDGSDTSSSSGFDEGLPDDQSFLYVGTVRTVYDCGYSGGALDEAERAALSQVDSGSHGQMSKLGQRLKACGLI